MSAFLRKYGTGTGADIYITMIKRAVVDHAVSADWTPSAGDVKISKDGGAAANIGTLPVAVAMGNSAIWKFVFTDAELQAAYITVTIADSATKAVEDNAFAIETYGNASALHAFDLDTATQTVLVSSGTGAGQISLSSGLVTLAGVTHTGAVIPTVSAVTGLTASNLDAAITSRLASADISLSGGAVTVGTNSDKTGYALSATGSAAMTEGYAALGAAPTLVQMLYEIRALLAEKAVSSTTLTTKKLDGSTTAATYTLDDATTPTAITRAS